MLSCLFLLTEEVHPQLWTTAAVGSNGLEPWVLVTQGIESRHRLRGSAPSTRYLRDSGLVFVVHSARTRPSGIHPAEPDLCSSALHASCLQVARQSWQLDCSAFRSRHPSILFSVPGPPSRVRAGDCSCSLSRGRENTHASRVALRLCYWSNSDALQRGSPARERLYTRPPVLVSGVEARLKIRAISVDLRLRRWPYRGRGTRSWVVRSSSFAFNTLADPHMIGRYLPSTRPHRCSYPSQLVLLDSRLIVLHLSRF